MFRQCMVHLSLTMDGQLHTRWEIFNTFSLNVISNIVNTSHVNWRIASQPFQEYFYPDKYSAQNEYITLSDLFQVYFRKITSNVAYTTFSLTKIGCCNENRIRLSLISAVEQEIYADQLYNLQKYLKKRFYWNGISRYDIPWPSDQGEEMSGFIVVYLTSSLE